MNNETVITFLIGNGFDLNLEFDTAYKHFYDHLAKNYKGSKNLIIQSIIKEGQGKKRWADFESGLGLHVGDAKVTDENFQADRDEIIEILNDYLKNAMEGFDFSQKNVTKMLEETVRGIAEDFSDIPNTNADAEQWLKSRLGRRKKVNFVNFNYTPLLAAVINSADLESSLVDYNASVHHIHGRLDEHIIIGVGDLDQIEGAEKLGNETKKHLVKPTAISSLNDGKLSVLANIINESEIIILYGLSVGDTDKPHWERLMRWLIAPNAHSRRVIIIHHHEPGYKHALSTQKREEKQTQIKHKLLKHKPVQLPITAAAAGAIYPVINSKTAFNKKHLSAPAPKEKPKRTTATIPDAPV
ncbi:bacteriophage abortive infection AbiH family protein [Candidatus Saccharibacteria bacterium]|nr:bacteriophage abortive infection AbiH family protein [Candidatus Saccharibacteria bacterium]